MRGDQWTHAESDSNNWSCFYFLLKVVSLFLETEVPDKGQDAKGILWNVITSPRAKILLYPQEEAVRRKSSIWNAPRRGQVHCFFSNLGHLSLLFQEPFPSPMSLAWDTCPAPLIPSSSWIREKQSTSEFTYLSGRSAALTPSFSFEGGAEGRSAGHNPPPAIQGLSQLQRTSSPQVTLFPDGPQPLLREMPTGHGSNGQHSLQCSWPCWPRPFRTCIVARLLPLPGLASGSFPLQVLDLMSMLLQRL